MLSLYYLKLHENKVYELMNPKHLRLFNRGCNNPDLLSTDGSG